MGRKLKPTKRPSPTTKVAHVEARRAFIWNLMLIGASPRDIKKAVAEHQTFACSHDTVEEDMRALNAEASTYFREKREHYAAEVLAKLDRIHVQLERAAQDAQKDGNWNDHVRALAQARQTVMDQAKIAGVVVDRQEFGGVIANVHLSTQTEPEQIASFLDALRRANVSVTDAASLLEAA